MFDQTLSKQLSLDDPEIKVTGDSKDRDSLSGAEIDDRLAKKKYVEKLRNVTALLCLSCSMVDALQEQTQRLGDVELMESSRDSRAQVRFAVSDV